MTKRSTTEEFILKAKLIYGNECDYSCVKYINSRTKIAIICIKHNYKYMQYPGHHLHSGKGCALCHKENVVLANSSNPNNFFNICREKHNNLYDYSLAIYTGIHNKIDIICPVHNIFSQIAHNHINGRGCNKCAREYVANIKKLNINDLIARAHIIHNNKYDYSLVSFINNKTKITIICKIHGEFYKTPINHLINKQGCPKCSHSTSNSEIEWLNYIGIPIKYRNKTLKIGDFLIKPDAYDSNTNTIYEFYGDYWHGNPKIYNANDINKSSKKTFRELYEKTIQRETMIKSAGYKIIYIWESDWNKLKY